MDKVGLVGYGVIGTEFARRLRESGDVELLVYDTAPEARRRATSDGLEVAPSGAELTKCCDIIDIIVRTDAEAIDATIGGGGAVSEAKSGTTVLLHSTILPETTFEIASAADARGIKVADACITGQVFLLGASSEFADEIRPHLLRMGDHVIHMGPLGAGNVAKLMKNLVNASERLIIWEALQIGEAAGIPYVQALEMMRFNAGPHRRTVDSWEKAFDPSGADLVPWCGMNLFSKDVPLAAELARAQGLDLPIIEQLAASGSLLVRLNEGREWTNGEAER